MRLAIILLFITSILCGQSIDFICPSVSNTGEAWFNNGRYYGNWTKIRTAIGVALNGDVGQRDQTLNHIDGTAINGVLADNVRVSEVPVPGFVDTGNDAINIGQTTALKTAFRSSHEQHWFGAIEDGQIAASYNLYGTLNASTGYVNCYVETNGRLNFGYATAFGSNAVNWQSAATDVIVNGDTGFLYLLVRWDFEADAVTVWKNGVLVAGSVTAGTLSSVNPTLWDTSQDFYVGALNNAGSISTNTQNIHQVRFAVTDTGTPASSLTYFSTIFDNALWLNEFRVTASNASATREAIIDAIFSEGTLPTASTPNSTASVVSGSIHGVPISTILNKGTITRWTYIRDGATNKLYYITSTASPRNEVMIYCNGHSPANDILAVNNYLAEGYDVVYAAMAASGDPEDLGDNTASGTWTPVAGGNHNEMSPLNVSGLQYFLFDKFAAINYLDANFSHNHIYMSGLSGGGWTTVFVSALDTRIEKSFPIRGYKPRIYKCYSTPALSDFEQGGSNGTTTGSGQAIYDFFTTYTYESLIALGTTGGRRVYTVTHTDDTALLGGNSFNTWSSTMQTLAVTLSGTYGLFLNSAGAEANHQIWQSEMNAILAQL